MFSWTLGDTKWCETKKALPSSRVGFWQGLVSGEVIRQVSGLSQGTLHRRLGVTDARGGLGSGGADEHATVDEAVADVTGTRLALHFA